MVKKKKILFGAVDIGFRIEHYSKFIREKFSDYGEAESFSKYVLPKEHYQTSYTYEYPIDKLPAWKMYFFSFRFFLKALFTYDVFHFFSGETLLTRKLRPYELMVYKLLGKKVIMHFVGADIRSEKYLEEKRKKIVDYLNGEQLIQAMSEPYQQKLIQDARKYADRIIVSTPDLLQIIPEADYVPVFLDLDNIESNFNNETSTDTIKILHSPSGFHTKGSEYIHAVLEKVQLKHSNVELITPMINSKKTAYAMTRYELLNTLKSADIVVDQMLIGWYGLKAVEALAMGATVVCYIDETSKKYLFENNPIVNASVLTLETTLNEMILKLTECNQRKIRQELQINWVKEFHGIDTQKEYFYDLWFN